jgi:hypothetical protein
MVFLGPRANAELVSKFHVTLHATYAALPNVTSQFQYNAALPTLIINAGFFTEHRFTFFTS